jgi:hexosaminidase
MMLLSLLLLQLCSVVSAAELAAQIPSVQSWTSAGGHSSFALTPVVRVIVNERDAHHGSPSLLDFATTFREDLIEVTGWPIAKVQLGSSPTNVLQLPTIFVSLGATTNFTYLSGKETHEGYEFDVSPSAYVIRANAPIGVWWATRTLLQQITLAKGTGTLPVVLMPNGKGVDMPGWEVRGAMLDVGRHFFTTGFISGSHYS